VFARFSMPGKPRSITSILLSARGAHCDVSRRGHIHSHRHRKKVAASWNGVYV
jgi:hypothetical protein